LPILTALLVVVTCAQARLLYWTYIADHRPRLIIRHVALASEPDQLIAVSPSGAAQVKPLEVALVLSNPGGSDARIIEGNMTLQVYGRDTIEEIVRGAKNVPLPPFDNKTGLPAYSSDRTALVGTKIRPADRRVVKRSMAVPESTFEAVRPYLAIHPKDHLEHTAFFVFGYFKYRDSTRRAYVTRFCRRYDAAAQKFIAIDNSRLADKFSQPVDHEDLKQSCA
jgi:hypothetical protein